MPAAPDRIKFNARYANKTKKRQHRMALLQLDYKDGQEWFDDVVDKTISKAERHERAA